MERNERVRKATFKGRMFSGILFPVMNGMSLVNTAIVIFAGSAVLLNDPSIETTTALGLIVMFTPVSYTHLNKSSAKMAFFIASFNKKALN